MTADNSLCLVPGPGSRQAGHTLPQLTPSPWEIGAAIRQTFYSANPIVIITTNMIITNTQHFLSAGPSSKCSLINLFNPQQPCGGGAVYLSWTHEETEAQRAHREVAEPGLEPRPPGPSVSVSTDRARVAVTSLPTWAQGLCLFSPGGSMGSQT